MRVIQNLKGTLAQWVYTRDEWETFVRWDKRRKGFIPFLFHKLGRTRRPEAPEIRITGENIWMNEKSKYFLDHQHTLKRVNIRDAGAMNVLEIIYKKINGRNGGLKELRIPVPKGKLREAMEVYDCLCANTFQ